jgi:hypothetical protein
MAACIPVPAAECGDEPPGIPASRVSAHCHEHPSRRLFSDDFDQPSNVPRPRFGPSFICLS